jgi:hypothetical protein
MAAVEDFKLPDDLPAPPRTLIATPSRAKRAVRILSITVNAGLEAINEPGACAAINNYFRTLFKNACSSSAEDVAGAFIVSAATLLGDFAQQLSTKLQESASEGK